MKQHACFLALALAAGIVQAEPAHLGMIGVAQDQTLRLNVVARAGSVADLPPGPCKVLLGFFNSDGKMVGDPFRLALEPGKAGHLDIQGREASPERRTELLPAVYVSPSADEKSLCPGVAATVEIIDTETGKTSVFYNDPILY
jgi:hypothetical protein